ncbi:MAG TPA: hypothetical protein VIH14_07705 [Anaerolineales bacterium]
MDTERRSSIAIGLVLVLVGGWFLAGQIFPQLNELIPIQNQWPWWVIAAGVLFLLMAAVLRAPGMAVPAAIITGIGGILYYQNTSGDWKSWAYAWALIPGFAGVGVIIMGLFEGRFLHGLREGLGTILFSLFMFGVFGAFLGGPPILRQLWPIFLIGAGIWVLLGGIRRPRKPLNEGQAEE